MNLFSTKSFIISALMTSICACGTRTQDSPAGTAEGKKKEWQLKDLRIDAAFMFPEGSEALRGVPFTGAMTQNFRPQSVDEFYGPESTYYLVDSIGSSEIGKVFLIAKSDPNETSAWLVIYNTRKEVAHQLEVFYENAEGNFYLHSEINDNLITIAGENITPEPEPVSRFRIAGLRWQPVQ